EPDVDVVARGLQRQSSARRNERRPGDAPPRPAGGQPADDVGAEGGPAGAAGRHRTGEPGGHLRTAIRSLGRVRRAARRLAGMVLVSGAVRSRAGNRVRRRLRHRALRRVRLGMGPLGIRLGSPYHRVQPQHVRLAQQDVHQSPDVRSRACELRSRGRVSRFGRIPWCGRASRPRWVSRRGWIWWRPAARIRGPTRSRRSLGCLQRIRSWRHDQEPIHAWLVQLRRVPRWWLRRRLPRRRVRWRIPRRRVRWRPRRWPPLTRFRTKDEMEKRMMSTPTDVTRAPSRARCRVWIPAVVAAVLVFGHPPSSVADPSETKTFPSAGDASEALFQAVQNGDERALQATLGAGEELTSCGDESTDKRERDRFVQKYQEMHRLVGEPDGTTVLYIGAENWPFPIPLVSRKGRWHFDAQTGAREVMFRRIGADEVTAIEVCRAAVQASKQNGATTRSDDPIVQYAE